MYKAKKKVSRRKHFAFPEGLERIKWLEVDGVRYRNTNYKRDPNGERLTVGGYDDLVRAAAKRREGIV